MELLERPMMRNKEYDMIFREIRSIARELQKRLPEDKDSQALAARREEMTMMLRHRF